MEKNKAVATNKKAFRDYSFFERWECGIELKGAEVKSIREKNISIEEGFGRVLRVAHERKAKGL